jgi:hypothetical protein
MGMPMRFAGWQLAKVLVVLASSIAGMVRLKATCDLRETTAALGGGSGQWLWIQTERCCAPWHPPPPITSKQGDPSCSRNRQLLLLLLLMPQVYIPAAATAGSCYCCGCCRCPMCSF